MFFKKDDRIGDFTVAFPHKQGAYAETYRVKDPNGKPLFLKLIDRSKLDPSQMSENGGIMEVEVAELLHGDNLCKFADSGDLSIRGRQFTWFATEFVSGETLAQRLSRGASANVYEIKVIAKAVLSALSFLHSLPHPVIHNEVTVQNVLLDLTGGLEDLKLIDFGHACHPEKIGCSYAGVTNPPYLAPERFFGICSAQTDTYAVGAMMYQLLYGQLPWIDDAHVELGHDSIEEYLSKRKRPPRFPDNGIFELDSSLTSVIAKSLSYKIADRFQTADEFKKAIDGELKVEDDHGKGHTKAADRQQPKGGGFAAVAGMEDLKRTLREQVIEPLNNPEEYRRYGITIPNGMLLYGPPGCGKTFFAKHFAEEVGFNFICATPATLKSRYVNATQENIAHMFKEAEKNSPNFHFHRRD